MAKLFLKKISVHFVSLLLGGVFLLSGFDRCFAENAPDISPAANQVVSDDAINTVVPDDGFPSSVVELQLPLQKTLNDNINNVPLSMHMPIQVPFSLDPENIMGKGQVFSKDVYYENNSDVDVIVTIYNPGFEFATLSQIEASVSEFEDVPGEKKIFLKLVSDDGTKELVFGDDKNSLSFVLSADKNADNHRIDFHVEGMLSSSPGKGWRSNEVSIKYCLSYKPIADKPKDEMSAGNTPVVSDGAVNVSDSAVGAISNEVSDGAVKLDAVNVAGAILNDSADAVRAWILDVSAKSDSSIDENGLSDKNELNAVVPMEEAEVIRLGNADVEYQELLDAYRDWCGIADNDSKLCVIEVSGGALEAVRSCKRDDLTLPDNLEKDFLEKNVRYLFNAPVSLDDIIWHMDSDVAYGLEQPMLWSYRRILPGDDYIYEKEKNLIVISNEKEASSRAVSDASVRIGVN